MSKSHEGQGQGTKIREAISLYWTLYGKQEQLCTIVTFVYYGTTTRALWYAMTMITTGLSLADF